MSDRLPALEAQLRLKMRYGSANEVRKAAYELRLHLELHGEREDLETQTILLQTNRLIERLEKSGFDPLERKVRHWLELLEELSARLRTE